MQQRSSQHSNDEPLLGDDAEANHIDMHLEKEEVLHANGTTAEQRGSAEHREPGASRISNPRNSYYDDALYFDADDGFAGDSRLTDDELLQLRGSLLAPRCAPPDEYPLWAKLSGLSWGMSPAWTSWCVVYVFGILGLWVFIFYEVLFESGMSVFGVFTVLTPEPPEVLGTMQLLSVILSGVSHIFSFGFAARHRWAPPCATQADPKRRVDLTVYGFTLLCLALLTLGNFLNPGKYRWEMNLFVWAV